MIHIIHCIESNNLVKTKSISIDKTFDYNYTRQKFLYMIWVESTMAAKRLVGVGVGDK